MLLTVKPSTLLAWARDGRVPVLRLGPRHLRWTRPLLREIRDAALDLGHHSESHAEGRAVNRPCRKGVWSSFSQIFSRATGL